MRIAIVSDAWRPQINGVVRTVETVAKLLQAEGHEVEVFGPDRFRTLPCPTYPEIRLSLFPAARLHHMLKLFAPDAIHLVTEGPLGWAARALLPRSAASPSPPPITRAFPNMCAPAFGCRSPGATPSCAGSMRRRRRVLVVAQSIRDELTRARLQEPRAVVARRRHHRLQAAARARNSADPRPIWLYAGRVAIEKNIKAFLELDLPGTKWVVGGGPQLKELQRRYKDARFFGSVNTEELSARYAEADCFVFPSRTDTFGLVMVEALASGVPVAGYPVPGPLDVVTTPKVGAVDEDLRAACLAAIGCEPADCRAHAETFTWARCATAVPRHPAPDPAQHLAAAEAPRGAQRGVLKRRLAMRPDFEQRRRPWQRSITSSSGPRTSTPRRSSWPTSWAFRSAPQWGPFVPVKTSNGVTLDFIDGGSDVRMQHYAFLVDDAEFDAAFARIKKAGLTYWADPHKEQPGEINRHWGGRGVYFEDPNGHLLELITKPYGDLASL